MAQPRFYEPGIIKLHPRVTRKTLNTRCDLYVGAAEDLIEAGVLQEHMLPPRVSLSWRPAGSERQAGESVMNLPGYLTVTKDPQGVYRVFLTVSREQRTARQEREERKAAEWLANVQRPEPKPAAGGDGVPRAEPRRMDAEDFKAVAMLSCLALQKLITSGMDGLALASADQQGLLAATNELQALVRSARVLDTTKRKHLMLAWSA
jgi:hypothetical protein